MLGVLFVHLKLNSNFECEFQTKFEFESRKEIKKIPLKQINGIIKIWVVQNLDSNLEAKN
jgi:hypothetical protein